MKRLGAAAQEFYKRAMVIPERVFKELEDDDPEVPYALAMGVPLASRRLSFRTTREE